MVLKKIFNITTLLFVALSVPIVSCNMSPRNNNIEDVRKQKVVDRDAHGRIIKTFDGFIYRTFDSLGRLVEWYGNYKNTESNSNIHNFVEYSDSVIVAKEYVLEDDNTRCKILDSLKCSISKYYYKTGKLIRREYYSPNYDNGKIVGHKLVETADNPTMNPFVHKLPKYLK